MPTYVRTTNPPLGTGLPTAGQIATTKANVVAGSPIQAADIQNIVTWYNAFLTHTHATLDTEYVAYAPLPAYPTTTITTTSSPPALPSLALSFASGAAIVGTTRVSLATAINNMRVHTHAINDHSLP